MEELIDKLYAELTEKVDSSNQLELEKVKRYINLVTLFYQMDLYIKEHGPVVVTKNGAQEFMKVNPAIQEKSRINAQLLNIEKSFCFDIDNSPDLSDGSDLI